MARPCPWYFIRAFLISALPIASPYVSLAFAGCSLPSWAGWGARGGLCSLRGICTSPAGLWPLASLGQRVGSKGSSDTSRGALSRSVCFLRGLPNKNCFTAKAGLAEGAVALRRVLSPRAPAVLAEPIYWCFFLRGVITSRFTPFLTEHLSKWV